MKPEKLAEVEKEIISLLEDCQRQGLTGDQLLEVFSPLGITKSMVASFELEQQKKESKKQPSSSKWKIPSLKSVLVVMAIIAVAGALVLAYDDSPTSEMMRFRALSVVRIALIKLLPIWKWTDLYYSKCLLKNPFYEAMELNPDDCNLCETLEDIDRLSNTSQVVVLDDYIRREMPFVVTDAMDGWPIMNTDQLWFDNITETYIQANIPYVCNLNTNIRGSYEFRKIARKIYNPRTTQWFLHWENCQKDGAKATRMFYQKPYFVSNSLDFTGSNWVLMSSEFKGRVYKKIQPQESLMMLYQIRGSNHIRLSPREVCKTQCPELSTTINEGEILIVGTMLWVIEYIPGEYGDNLAIISEVSWPEVD